MDMQNQCAVALRILLCLAQMKRYQIYLSDMSAHSSTHQYNRELRFLYNHHQLRVTKCENDDNILWWRSSSTVYEIHHRSSNSIHLQHYDSLA
eukprot:3740349-Amphidinium_carterae.2